MRIRQDQEDFLKRRYLQEARAALDAQSELARRAHHRMAQAYADRLKELLSH